MKAAIITIGDEILLGQILDTNSRFMARELTKLGAETVGMYSIADERNAIAGRVKTPIIHMGMENPVTKEFVFDPLVRYPDIITGVFSSISIYEQRTPK